MALEMRGLAHGLVTRRKSLAELLQEERPGCRTKEGDDYLFEVEVLRRFAAVTSPEEQAQLRLPITLTFHAEMGDQCCLDDETAAEALRRLEHFGKAYPFRDDRMWLPYALGLELLMKYPTAFQRMLVP